jgi:hypothetical protein
MREVAQDGGYILDASAIMQNDTSPENLRVLTATARELGVYSGAGYQVTAPAETRGPQPSGADLERPGLAHPRHTRRAPGVCVPWMEKRRELPEITGDAGLIQRVWEANDALGNAFIWQCLLSF